MNRIYLISYFTAIILLAACTSPKPTFDASGSFEAEETIISSESGGKILQLNIEEGSIIAKDSIIGKIDPLSIQLQKEQLTSSINAIGQKTTDAAPQVAVIHSQILAQQKQISVFNTQLQTAQKEQTRIQNLVEAKAVPAKQLDDVNAQINIINDQIAAAKSQIDVLHTQITSQEQGAALQNKAILSERAPAEKRIALIQDQLNKTKIINPITGTILAKYAETYEMTAPGKPLYKIADLSNLTLRAYVTGNQLPQIKLGQQVKVSVDASGGKMKELPGTIYWISDKSEFTPKSIQTKEERANLVYAIKIKVKNDGYLKIGMYGEVKWDTQ